MLLLFCMWKPLGYPSNLNSLQWKGLLFPVWATWIEVTCWQVQSMKMGGGVINQRD